MGKIKFKLLRILINFTAILYIIFEEVFIYLSSILNKIINKIPKFENILIKINEYLERQHRYTILFYIFLLLLISEIIGIMSFAFLSMGSFYLFVVLYVVKFFPFFVMSYIFKRTKNKLLEIVWFNYLYTKYCAFSNYIKNTEIVINIKKYKDIIKTYIKLKINQYKGL